MNYQLAKNLIERLLDFGVHDFIVCAGARNAPLIQVLGEVTDPQFKDMFKEKVRMYNFFDERAAGFFALGRTKRDRLPVAIITTSGTAVAELLPSVIEAHYSGHSLVCVTADRPRSFRGSGAPQAIEQVGIFSHYTQGEFDIENINELESLRISVSGPTHINICFNEPLLDQKKQERGTQSRRKNRAREHRHEEINDLAT